MGIQKTSNYKLKLLLSCLIMASSITVAPIQVEAAPHFRNLPVIRHIRNFFKRRHIPKAAPTSGALMAYQTKHPKTVTDGAHPVHPNVQARFGTKKIIEMKYKGDELKHYKSGIAQHTVEILYQPAASR